MTQDPRIAVLEDAALRMQRGEYDVQLPNGAEDDVAKLGAAMQGLASSLDRRFQQVQTLLSVTERVNAGLLLEEVCDHVYEAFKDLIPYDRIGVALLEDDDQVLRARWARTEYDGVRLGRGYSAPMAGSSLLGILETGRPRILNDLVAHLEAHPGSRSTRLVVAEGVRASLTCPLIAVGKPVGFMFFSSREPHCYAHAHVELYRHLAGQLAVIIEKSRLYQQLVDLSELRSRYIGMAAHDLRNPLMAIEGYLQLVLRGLAGDIPDQARDMLTRAESAAVKMVELVNDLLDVETIDRGKLVLKRLPVDVGPWLLHLVEGQELLAGSKDIRLSVAIEDGLPAVEIDPGRMDQAMTNLVTNAIKYSQPGTTTTVGARRDGQRVQLFVRDEGLGIPEAEQGKLFTEFGRTSVRPTGGERSIGLGLAITRRHVEAHGGHITVESAPGEGSTFTVTLPIHAAPPRPEALTSG